MSTKDYSHIKQGMYVLKEDIKDEETWRAVRDAFLKAGANDASLSCNSTYQKFLLLYDGKEYYGWSNAGGVIYVLLHYITLKTHNKCQ